MLQASVVLILDCLRRLNLVYRDRLKCDAPGFVKFVPALAYHFCLNLPAAFMQLGAYTHADLYITKSLVCEWIPYDFCVEVFHRQ